MVINDIWYFQGQAHRLQHKDYIRGFIDRFYHFNSLPLLGNGGMSYMGNKNSMEANGEQYHAHLWLGLSLAQVCYSKMQKQHSQHEVVQMS